ncbi:MAG: histidine utilization repressor [Acidobacteria bacterium]|nr:histidine utilization repressor [Acidobacteriota bacterium]
MSPSPLKPGSALYLAVKEHIRARIQDGTWKVGDRIPSEHELVGTLKVSRMTVHRALRELAEQGALTRVAGVGTFVAEPKAQSGLTQVANLADEVRARGHRYECRLVAATREPATAELAAQLELQPGDSVFHVVCIHLEEGVPMQLEDRWVNPEAVPDFLTWDFQASPPGEQLLRAIPLDEVEHIVDAVPASSTEAEWLQIHEGDPCLVLTRRTWSRNRPVTWVRCIHPGSRYRLGTRFKVGSQPMAG